MRFIFTVIFVLLLSLLSFSFAVRIEITTNPDDPNTRLEFRPITLPDGSETELIVIQSTPVRVTVDEDVITADYIEFDRENGLVRVVGPGTYTSGEEVLEGEDFTVNLDDETLQGQDVFIITGAIDVVGAGATRLPGQISVTSGAFSPCSRCDQTREDYGFRAQRLELYPGDRLIAFDVTVLIRNHAAFSLPFLIVPLGPEDRRPRLAITRGTATARAAVAVDWPYVVGATAFGVTSLRYYADVTPGAGGPFANTLLGGRARVSYFGGGFTHTFFTRNGQGQVEFAYLPSFIDRDLDGDITSEGKTPDEFTVRFSYDTLEETLPEINVLIDEDDARNQRIIEYSASAANTFGGLDARILTQGFFDLDRGDEVLTPSYAGSETPLRTYIEGTLALDDALSFSVGPFVLSNALLDIGFFEDFSNPINRSAALERTVRAARLLEGHTVALQPLTLWPGLVIEGGTDFLGRYYTTRERLIDWDSALTLRQGFGDVGGLELSFVRNISEGETPFSFDRVTLFNETYADATLFLTPLPWLSFSANERYTFVNTRRRAEVGPGVLNLSLEFFDNLSWLDITLQESYNFEERDPGELTVDAVLSVPFNDDFDGSLEVNHVEDLKYAPDRLSSRLNNDSNTEFSAALDYRNVLRFGLDGGYTYDPVPVEGEAPDYWMPLELSLEAGTLDQEDALPGARLFFTRDLNEKMTRELGLEGTARVRFLEANFEQRLDFVDQEVSRSLYGLTWRGVATLEASGFALLPPSLFGLTLDPEGSDIYIFDLKDASQPSGEELWRLEYRVQRDRTPFTGPLGEGNVRSRTLQAFANTEPTTLGGVDFGVRFVADLVLPDDLGVTRTYLNTFGLTLSADFFGRVGLQGDVAYRATYDTTSDAITQALLTFDNLALTVRVREDLFVSAAFNDTWDLTGNLTSSSPFNFQPTLYVIWDRCCWALYGSLDTDTGAVTLSLTTPGGTQGVSQEFGTFLRLPGRAPVTGITETNVETNAEADGAPKEDNP